MLKITLVIFCLIISKLSFAQTFNLGRFSIAESRIQLNLNDFIIQTQNPSVEASWVPDSIQWIRNESNLLVPRALMQIAIKKQDEQTHLEYQKKIILPSIKDHYLFTEIYIDLFSPDIISVFSGNNLIEKITILPKAQSSHFKKLIDYSCAPYDLKVEGVDDEFLSIGCKMNRVGKTWNERSLLEITISSTNLKTLNNDRPPFIIYLNGTNPVEMKLKGPDQKIKTLKLSASVSEKIHRLNTSVGFGPYVYHAQEGSLYRGASLAPSLMVYAKYDLSETASFKAFDALLWAKSFFNNSGLYFSYDLAMALDGRVVINALLGFQGLRYQYSKDTSTVSRLIYPQGFEVLYKHAFIENYQLAYGMFLSTTNEKYTNAWLRYGKKNFLELNYIKWGHENSNISMWGLSLGIPFFSIL